MPCFSRTIKDFPVWQTTSNKCNQFTFFVHLASQRIEIDQIWLQPIIFTRMISYNSFYRHNQHFEHRMCKIYQLKFIKFNYFSIYWKWITRIYKRYCQLLDFVKNEQTKQNNFWILEECNGKRITFFVHFVIHVLHTKLNNSK